MLNPLRRVSFPLFCHCYQDYRPILTFLKQRCWWLVCVHEVYSGIKPDSPPWLLNIYLNVRSEELILHQSNIFSEHLNLSSGARLGHEAVSRKQGNPFNKLNAYKDYETIFFLWRDQSLCSLIRGIAPNGNFLEENFPFYLPHNFHLSAQQFAQIIEGYIITNAERQTINLGNPLPREPWESRETTLIEQNEKTKDCFVFYDS